MAARCARGFGVILLGVYWGPVLVPEFVFCISLLLEVTEGLLYLLASWSSLWGSGFMSAAHTVQYSALGSIGFNSLSIAFVPKPVTLPSKPPAYSYPALLTLNYKTPCSLFLLSWIPQQGWHPVKTQVLLLTALYIHIKTANKKR